MPRQPRLVLENGVYHVTARGNRKDPIFFSDRDRFVFLKKLNAAFSKYSTVCFAYCLMPNHYHLFIKTPLPNLSECLHDLNASYSNWLKAKHAIVGVIFQGRFKSLLVDEDAYAVALSAYIHLNPCRAGIAAKPEDYRWSSCRDYLGLRRPWVRGLDSKLVLGFFGTAPWAAARSAYGVYLNERKEMKNPIDVEPLAIAAGGDVFQSIVRAKIAQTPTSSGAGEDAHSITPIEKNTFIR